MDTQEKNPYMNTYRQPFGVSLSPFDEPKYPPMAKTVYPPPSRVKEMMVKNDPTFSAKLQVFQKMYLEHASSLLTMGHKNLQTPFGKSEIDQSLIEEIERLRKENAELRKRVEQLKSTKL